MKANTEEQQIVDAISGMFTALATEDTAKFHSVTSPDFYVFDGDTRFDGDKMAGVIKTPP